MKSYPIDGFSQPGPTGTSAQWDCGARPNLHLQAAALPRDMVVGGAAVQCASLDENTIGDGEMAVEEMREAFAELRTALDQLEVGAVGSKHPGEKIAALSGAVDTLRTKVWAHLTTHQVGDLDRYLGQIRVQRATEACEDLLADLYAGTLARGTPGLDLLRGALRELSKASKLAKA